jgi:DNA-binding NarL/FixJ family response regulator
MHRVLIVSDVRFYRDGLAESFRDCDDVKVEGTVSTADALTEFIATRACTIVLLDRTLPGALGTLRAHALSHPDVKFIVLGVTDEEDDFLCYAEAGAAGYVTKDCSLTELSEIVHSTGRGELRCSPRMAAALLRRVAGQRSRQQNFASVGPLTSRETEILRLVEEGMSNKQIAATLILSVTTVKNHVHHLLEKLRMHRRAQAGAWLRSQEPGGFRPWHLKEGTQPARQETR